jgi:haloacetate dehalogenase
MTLLHTLPIRRATVSQAGVQTDLQAGTAAIEIAYRTFGDAHKPPLLLLHGHPQTHLIWHKVAQPLSERFQLVLPDLRGYGRSSKPAGDGDHANYSKRVMAQDLVSLMQQLGHASFAVCAHDRGARVAHRMALDHPKVVEKLMVLDIAPTLAMYEQTTEAFARAYWHWFFLIQPTPLPETLISANPEQYCRSVMGGRHAGMAPFTDEALADYVACLTGASAAHGVCEDYRAAASIDLVHDRESRAQGQLLEVPFRVLWGKLGVVEKCFKPLEEWRKVARDPGMVSGTTLDCGHYLPEEAPDALLAEISGFF